MGGIAGAAGRGQRLTYWAFTVEDVPRCVNDRTALVLAPTAVASLMPQGDACLAIGEPRRGRRRQVLAALAARAGSTPDVPVDLISDADGVRRLTRDSYASVAERLGWAAAVVSRRPVGIDIESVVEAEQSATAVLDGVDIVDLGQWYGLAGVWAAREAVLKALGRDLTSDPGGWRFGHGVIRPSGCCPHRVELVRRPGVVVAVAYTGS